MSVAGLSPKTPVVVRNLIALAATPDAIMVADRDDLATSDPHMPWIARSTILECEPTVRANLAPHRDGRKRARNHPIPITLTVPLWVAQDRELLFEDPPEAR